MKVQQARTQGGGGVRGGSNEPPFHSSLIKIHKYPRGRYPEEVGHKCTALRQSRNTWPLQPIQLAESADHSNELYVCTDY